MAFACDASKLRPGDVVLVEKPAGSSGQTTYPHFFIVLSVPEPLKVGDAIPCVGITSRVSSESFDPERHVRMRWLGRKGGDPATGLDRPSVADITFRHILSVKAGTAQPLEAEAEHRGKYIKADHFQALVAAINAYNRKLLLQRKQEQGPKPEGA